MPLGYRKDGSKLGFQKGNKINIGRKYKNYPPQCGFQKGNKVNSDRKLTEDHKKKLGKNPRIGQANNLWKDGRSRIDPKIRRMIDLEAKAGRKRPMQCEICENPGKICFDHCHKTGNFRGWLCSRCNLVAGLVKDNPKVLDRMADYLRDSQWEYEQRSASFAKSN